MARSRPDTEPGYDWLKMPGIFCDTYTADYFPSSNVIRINFGEYTDREHWPFYRAAVVLPLSDAKRLRATLNRLIREAEEPPKVEAAEPPDA